MVIDASVWVSAFITEDVHHRASRDWLRARTDDGERLAVPTLVLAEVAGAITRRTGVADFGYRSADRVRRTAGLRLIALDGELGVEAAGLAARLRLRGADAVYVATASRLNLPLVSWDQETHERAGVLIEVIRPSI